MKRNRHGFTVAFFTQDATGLWKKPLEAGVVNSCETFPHGFQQMWKTPWVFRRKSVEIQNLSTAWGENVDKTCRVCKDLMTIPLYC